MHRRTWRFVFFALAILAGFAAGLGYGWLIHPVGYHSIDPQTLQIDYQTDFVLMVAELYRAAGDLAMALARLDFLGGSPQVTINDAIDYANTRSYAAADLQLMQDLASVLRQALDGRD